MEVLALVVLATASVCLWTIRVAVTTRGHRLLAPVLAAVESLVYVTAFGRLMADLGSIERKLGFALGVAVGTAIAMRVTDRVGPPRGPDPVMRLGDVPPACLLREAREASLERRADVTGGRDLVDGHHVGDPTGAGPERQHPDRFTVTLGDQRG